MQFIRCKCGQHTGWTSMGLGPDCEGCKTCNTTLAYGPEGHSYIAPHDFTFKRKIETDQGEKELTLCSKCYKSKKQLGVE